MTRIGIITGSGSYALPQLEGRPTERAATRYGETEITHGRLAGVEVVHLSRHRAGHRLLSSHVNHRANIVALRNAGVDAIVGVTVCGSLDPQLAPGELIVFDDLHFLANRLPDGSICTLHDQPGAPGRGHWIFDEPFSRPLRGALLEGARASGREARDGGCYGHVDGPRFNTRAELRTLHQAGVAAISQTAGPEVVLAGEAAVPYGLLGFVTDWVNGIEPDRDAPVEEIARLIEAGTGVLAEALAATVPLIDGSAMASVGGAFTWD